MKFSLVVAKIDKAHALEPQVKEYLLSRGQKIVAIDEAEVAFVLGGDGTLIHSACEHIEKSIPFVGVNTGKLGFLTSVEADKWQDAVEHLIKGDFVVSERITLDCNVGNVKEDTTYRALNEVVVKSLYRITELELTVNGQQFLEISGDGVIVSTQTGSTAYSLSAGGPIVDPKVDCVLITPINAHGLPIPSIALSPQDLVEIKVKSGDDVSLVIDGQEHSKIKGGQKIIVTRGKHKVKFAYFDEDHFLKALKAKFGLSSRFTS